MNGVVLWSCHAINLLQMSSGSISGLARYGNSITLPLPNLVAKLAIVLLSVLCGHYSTSCFLFLFFFAHPVSFISVLLTFIVQTQNMYLHLVTAYTKWTSATYCHVFTVCSKVILNRFNFIFVCVCIIVHVDFSPNLRRLSWQKKRVWNSQTLLLLTKKRFG